MESALSDEVLPGKGSNEVEENIPTKQLFFKCSLRVGEFGA